MTSTVKISQLQTVATPQLSDFFPMVQGTMTEKETATQLQALIASAGGGITPAQLQNQSFVFAIDSGVANNYICTLSPAAASYVQGLRLDVLIATTNSGASTINVNGLGTKNIKLVDQSNPIAGNIVAGQVASLEYDGTNFQLLNPNNGLLTSNGTGALVRTTNASLITPFLGVASATSLAFSPTTNGIIGTATNDSASIGYAGEFVSSVIASGSAVVIGATTIPANITTISLTAGDWEVWGNVFLIYSSGAYTKFSAWTSAISATIPDLSLVNQVSGASFVGNNAISVPTLRYSLSASKTIYLSAQLIYSGLSATLCGGLYARRIR